MTTATQEPQMQKPAFVELFNMLSGYWVAQSIYAAAKLGIPDALANGPKTSDDLATELKANPDFLYRLLRALATINFVKEVKPRTFAITDISTLLRSDVPNSMLDMTLMVGHEHHYRPWGHLADSVQTGKLAFESVYGMNIFDMMSKDSESAEIFNKAMTSFVKNIHTQVMKHYDFSGIKTLVDIGGGHGLFLASILKEYPSLKGILFDLPHVVAGAKPYLESAGVADRCEVVGGDFFKEVAQGADAYIMAHIVHDWSDEHCIAFLKNVHQAMTPDGKLLVVDKLVKNDGSSPMAPWMDLNMLVMTVGGRERTEEEFRTLFDKAGFRLDRIVTTDTEHVILESVKK